MFSISYVKHGCGVFLYKAGIVERLNSVTIFEALQSRKPASHKKPEKYLPQSISLVSYKFSCQIKEYIHSKLSHYKHYYISKVFIINKLTRVYYDTCKQII